MEITIKAEDVLREPSELAMLACFGDGSLPDPVARLFEPSDFSGKAKQTLRLYPLRAARPQRLLLGAWARAGRSRPSTFGRPRRPS